jgi:hypothetical protein
MLMTTMVLVAGFATVTFSDMRDQRLFASMGVLTMLTAMIGDLVILPALLAIYAVPTPAERSPTDLPERESNDTSNQKREVDVANAV